MNEKIVIENNQKIIQSINSTSESIDFWLKKISEQTSRISQLVSSSKEHPNHIGS